MNQTKTDETTPTGQSFSDRLARAINEKRSAVCVGIDPRWAHLPDSVRSGTESENLPAVARATEVYCCEVLDAVSQSAAIVKPQAAFFEQMGPAGMQALSAVIKHATDQGLLVLLDGKRGDIGSTAEGYAKAYLGSTSPWGCDALTVNPYLGDDTLRPFVDQANHAAAGIFVLVKTSNPGSAFLQDQRVGETTVYQQMADLVQKLAKEDVGQCGYGSVGAVVGATYPEQLAELRQRMSRAWILIPGFGAQGGTARDVSVGFDSAGLGAIVNSSRGIIFAYNVPRYKHLPWQRAVGQAASDMADELQAELPN